MFLTWGVGNILQALIVNKTRKNFLFKYANNFNSDFENKVLHSVIIIIG